MQDHRLAKGIGLLPRRINEIALWLARAFARSLSILALFSITSPGAFASQYRYTITDLGTLGGTASVALGLNSSGQVVGWAFTTSNAQHAFLYSGGAMTDLNSLIDTNSGWTLNVAFAINDNGQIVGRGFNSSRQENAFL